ncbi:MAG: hypothetical protein IJG70_03360 [Kiritimatiellae bacterium]|nr:hypothetical protein [Kiritimatiellia bacterium]
MTNGNPPGKAGRAGGLALALALAPIAIAAMATLPAPSARGETVAYWPMNVVTQLYDGATQAVVPDAIDESNTLIVRDKTKGGVDWSANDIGWTTPPNPDATAGSGFPSLQKVSSGNNTTKIDNQFKSVFKTVAGAPVINALRLCGGFTVEGFAKFTELPADSAKNQMFIFVTFAEKGGWVWNLYGADANGYLSMKVTYAKDNKIANRVTLTLFDRLLADELKDVWNHYALAYTTDNGKGKAEWRFYLNGRLLGKSIANDSFTAYSFSSPSFFISGCNSGGNAQSLCGDMTCWRVSDKTLSPSELLCGGVESTPVGAFVWKGSADSAEWSTGAAANWTVDGEPAAWTDGKDTYFDDSCATSIVEIAGAVAPASINVTADSDMRLAFSSGRSSVIGASCTNFVKRGFGTFEIYYNDNKEANMAAGSFPIEVRDGCLKVTAVNSKGGLGDASRGYEVKVRDHARLWLPERNAIGSDTPDVANDSVFTVYTNGTFDISLPPNAPSGSFSIQTVGSLDLLGGSFVAPSWCHHLGYLFIRNRLTLGLNPGKRPYVFPNVRSADSRVYEGGITFGRNTEFRVEDATGDAASDVVFNCAVLARDRSGWQDAQNQCGFRKTGGGTMELNNTSYYGSDGICTRPTGVIEVEAGELKVNIDYSTPSKYVVAGGAFISGRGKVSKVEFAAGAGLRVDATKASVLELAGADFAGGGVVELSGVQAAALDTQQVVCAKIGDPVTGAENLAKWKVKAGGDELRRVVVRIRGGDLMAYAATGTLIIYR